MDRRHEQWNLYDPDDKSSVIADPSKHGVPKLEAHMYYLGVCGGEHYRWPKLIYRTSKDVFQGPVRGPHTVTRKMRLHSVHEHEIMDAKNLWPTIREETVRILDKHEIQLTSVDLARFSWEEFDETVRCSSDTRLSTGKWLSGRTTIWIGVVPDSTDGDAAHNSSQDILKLLEEHGINDIDVAYRESEARFLAGPQSPDPPLFVPVDNFHRLRGVIDPLSTSLSVPIASIRTLDVQGSLGFYFKVGETLYGATARHVLFPSTHGNREYTYTGGTRKDVVVMGYQAFEDHLVSIKEKITWVERDINSLSKQVEPGSRGQAEIEKKTRQMNDLKDLYITLQKWSVPNNRVIGHVVWSPPISGLDRHDTPNSSGGYTVDICVIELDANRFENWRGNVIGIDTEIEMPHFMGLMHPHREKTEDQHSEFKFPFDYLYHINKTAPATKLRETSNYDKDGDHVRFVIKSGSKTGTTVGRLNGYESHRRQYDIMGTFDSIETAVFPYGADRNSHYMRRKNPVKFAHIGDSGAVIVGDKEDFVAFITGGTGSDEYFEITYGTPFEWLWEEIIKPKFPDAVLFFDPIERLFY